MLFPIGDDNSARRITPVVTWALIGVNVLVFLYQMSHPEFTYGYSYVPAEITQAATSPVPIRSPAGACSLRRGRRRFI